MLFARAQACRSATVPRFNSPSIRGFTRTGTLPAKHSKSKLPPSPARTRFAPSPTGYLHLGSLRTALFNYLLAKKTGGQFILRVEDTDQKRTVPGAVDRLCSDLRWAGLRWDEGPGSEDNAYGPYLQSERTALYREHASKLLESGHAYRCFCSAKRLDDLARRRKELGLPTDYDRQCAGIAKRESDGRAAAGEAHVIRLLAPEVYPEVYDLVYGRIGKAKGPNAGIVVKHGESAYEDPVLLKSDGHPTYHLANVVDDHHMRITHVVRATEWISSTPKHLALYEAFGWTPPAFAHVGLLVDEAGHKLSKRNFDTDIAHFRDIGILPATLINFVALLGWSHNQRSDIMTLDQLVDQFQMQFTKGNTTVTLEKLWFLQRAHAAIAATTQSPELENMTRLVCAAITASPQNLQSPTATPLEPYTRTLLTLDAKNYSTASTFLSRNIHFFTPPHPAYRPFPHPTQSTISPTTTLTRAATSLISLPAADWTADALGRRIKEVVASSASTSTATLEQLPGAGDGQKDGVEGEVVRKKGEKAFNKLFCDFLRWVLLGGSEGPGLAGAMALLGREACVERFERWKDGEEGVVGKDGEERMEREGSGQGR